MHVSLTDVSPTHPLQVNMDNDQSASYHKLRDNILSKPSSLLHGVLALLPVTWCGEKSPPILGFAEMPMPVMAVRS